MNSGSPLAEHLQHYESLLVGFSGGVDSALLAVAARETLGRDRTVAALGVSPSLSDVQRDQARAIAGQFDLRLIEIETHEFTDAGYVANSTERCYFCKRELWSRLTDLAEELGMRTIADGTNADDLSDHRPGARAAREYGIRSPLAEVGFSQDDVRAEARARGMPIWDAPAAPCLSSRVLYGLSVTPVRVRQVEDGEAVLRKAGVAGDLRLRHRGDEARIEVARGELATVRANASVICERILDLGFSRVTLDIGGYRRGKLLDDAVGTVELLAERS